MSAIQTIFQRFGPSWLAQHPRTPIQLRRTIEAIIACRSAEMGSVCYDCQDCHCRHRIPASCGNRHCPQCWPGCSMNLLLRPPPVVVKAGPPWRGLLPFVSST